MQPIVPGMCQQIAPGLRRVTADNASPFTGPGTNSFLLGQGALALIDPGPDLPAHRAALMAALGSGERISHILVTHAHTDHSSGAAALSTLCDAPVLAYGGARAGIRPEVAGLASLGGGEGVDAQFRPDQILQDGEIVQGDDWQLQALWTPGHMGNHLCFDWNGCVFTGDLVMGWTTSLVSPPDGNLTDFMGSLERLASRPAQVFHPAHGDPVTEPQTRLQELLSHRRAREAQILQALDQGADTAQGLAQRIYTDIPTAMLGAASRNVLAHLIDLKGRNLVSCVAEVSADAIWSVC